ncbi:hypothetical protein ORV05_07270 [Amycolatopsis cynarae]|uniref:Uncharacterized protein n=1 Tax=Amycolatopsis cynarae TaxID=2995223 RepID=A0ABY7B6L2_9PSEU|nr:hypothetical protein [Amycolatopsis sp. HUAS 11-8]WAL67574.1 hypothetical protein ORV05_07270 [Amycolatopsis sp. HUAS 11-8]
MLGRTEGGRRRLEELGRRSRREIIGSYFPGETPEVGDLPSGQTR